MSPAPQGNLQVEQYIGSYLISQRPPNAANKRYQNQQQHVKPKITEEKVRFNKYCFPQRDVGGPGPPRYPMPPGLPVDCQGYNNHYKPDPGGSGWAGVPLISMTSGNPRRNKKPSATHNTQPQKYVPRQPHHQGHSKGKDAEEVLQDSDRSPLTRLAIHTQGAPLIQAGRYNNRSRTNNYNRDHNSRVYRVDGVRWDTVKEVKAPQGVQSKEQACGNTDSLSVASDESSGNSENSLPRIIKPRKRRKKDRKPLTTPTAETAQYPREPEQAVEPLTLNTFLPLCYEQNSENSMPDLLSGKHSSSVEDKEDLIDPLPSADEFPFGNLLDDEEDCGSEASSCAPATLCQCRYCDPSGVIWDVDQRCYSPFLTPPSPTDAKLQPLSFSPISRPYNRQVAPSHFFDGDLVSLLRRSWSDPSSYNSELSKSASAEWGRDRRASRPSSPAGLQVSSEIVTSPNGHRDIEIKFYSSSAPLESSYARSSAAERDPNERCFAVEE